ncbi:hypothetical protein B0H17DRAFT_1202537 [Mycena rosella]|uniref:Acyl-coenzyme A oxidase n=1 Tax=Mycena rosella TaxID=1033263 RepID=A0AAD7DEF0_MYCRO|nr:hypothetical protein B0H17DRAFT_1202537 [Mycena rosella]
MLEENLQHKHSIFDPVMPRYWMSKASPFGLHIMMFIPALKLLGSPEQLASWLLLAESGKIIGAYCQTELGHGSFLRGLETTAMFVQTTDKFVIHSPTSSTKYWPRGLGYSASHAIAMACLIVVEHDYGVHLFIAQLPVLDDNTPLTGIELGDIRLKLGHNSNDNSYCIISINSTGVYAVFTHFRVPWAHLMRNVQVLRDGMYVHAAHNKLVYGAMLIARKAIVDHINLQLAQAGNLAFDSTDSTKVPILAFRSQRRCLLTLMTRVLALHFVAKRVGAQYEDMEARRARGDKGALAAVYASMVGLKVYATQTTADGAEDMRKCCGGHGTTKNYMMYQQTARYLVKCGSSNATEVDGTVGYLRVEAVGVQLAPDADLLDPEIQLGIFRHRAARLVKEYVSALRVSETHGLTPAQVWNTHMMGLIDAARTHIEYLALHAFIEAICSLDSGPMHAVLDQLCSLFALSCIDGPHGLGFAEDGLISGAFMVQLTRFLGTQSILPHHFTSFHPTTSGHARSCRWRAGGDGTLSSRSAIPLKGVSSRKALAEENARLRYIADLAGLELEKNYAQMILMDRENARLRKQVFAKKAKPKRATIPMVDALLHDNNVKNMKLLIAEMGPRFREIKKGLTRTKSVVTAASLARGQARGRAAGLGVQPVAAGVAADVDVEKYLVVLMTKAWDHLLVDVAGVGVGVHAALEQAGGAQPSSFRIRR